MMVLRQEIHPFSEGGMYHLRYGKAVMFGTGTVVALPACGVFRL